MRGPGGGEGWGDGGDRGWGMGRKGRMEEASCARLLHHERSYTVLRRTEAWRERERDEMVLHARTSEPHPIYHIHGNRC